MSMRWIWIVVLALLAWDAPGQFLKTTPTTRNLLGANSPAEARAAIGIIEGAQSVVAAVGVDTAMISTNGGVLGILTNGVGITSNNFARWSITHQTPNILRAPIRGIDPWFANMPVGNKSSATNVTAMIDHLYTNGLTAHGWRYVHVTDGWQGSRVGGHLLPNALTGNLTNLCAYANARGIGLIIYTEPRTTTSAGLPGSLGYIEQDVADWIDAGAAGIRVDTPLPDYQQRMYFLRRFRAAIDAKMEPARPILLYTSGFHQYFLPGGNPAASLSEAISIADIVDVTLDNDMMGPTMWTDYLARWHRQLSAFYLNRHGHYLVPQGTGNAVNESYKSFWGLYALIASSQMIYSLDVNNSDIMAMLRNPDVRALAEDALMAAPVCVASNANYEVYSRQMANGDVAVALVNLVTNATTSVTCYLTNLGLSATAPYSVRDILNSVTLSNAVGSINASVPQTTAQVFRLSLVPTTQELSIPPNAWSIANTFSRLTIDNYSPASVYATDGLSIAGGADGSFNAAVPGTVKSVSGLFYVQGAASCDWTNTYVAFVYSDATRTYFSQTANSNVTATANTLVPVRFTLTFPGTGSVQAVNIRLWPGTNAANRYVVGPVKLICN